MSSAAATVAKRRADLRPSRAVLAWARDYGILAALIGLSLVFAFTVPAFSTSANVRNLLQESGEPGLIACGMTVVMIAGEFDLSVGAIFGFAGVIGAIIANLIGPAGGVGAGVLAGAGLGLINGTIVVRGRIQSFLVTLATQFVFVGVAIDITHGLDQWQLRNPAAFGQLADSTLAGVQYKAWFGLAGFVLIWLMLRYTRVGRQVYAVGGNPDAARVAGVRTGLVRIAVFMLSGALAAFAGLLAVSDTGAPRPTAASGWSSPRSPRS